MTPVHVSFKYFQSLWTNGLLFLFLLLLLLKLQGFIKLGLHSITMHAVLDPTATGANILMSFKIQIQILFNKLAGLLKSKCIWYQ